MIKHWWKVLGAGLILYSLIVGLSVPLKSGVLDVSPAMLNGGESYDITINTYNATFSDAHPVKVWIKIDDDNALAAKKVTVLGESKLSAHFDIPNYFPNEKENWAYSIIVDDEINGAFIRPRTVAVKFASIQKGNWQNDEITSLHKKDKMTFPFRSVLYETIRNTYFHVPMWFSMTIIFMISVFYSIKYLRKKDPLVDLKVKSLTMVGVLLGFMGLITGSLWARSTWGTWWTFSEIKMNMAAIALLIYLAYFVLRNSFDDEEKRAKISAVYNIFACFAMIPLLFVIPRVVTSSLHPGNGGNPAIGGEDLDNTMRLVFYPAVIGWILMGLWLATLVYRIHRIEYKLLDEN